MANPREFQRLIEGLNASVESPREFTFVSVDFKPLESRSFIREPRDPVLPKLRELELRALVAGPAHLGFMVDLVRVEAARNRVALVRRPENFFDTIEPTPPTTGSSRPSKFEGTGRKPKRMHKRNRRRGCK